MPKAIVIISDMEFDDIHANNKWDRDNVDWTFYGEMKERFEKSGYDMSIIVFWNVDSRNDVFQLSVITEEYKWLVGNPDGI